MSERRNQFVRELSNPQKKAYEKAKEAFYSRQSFVSSQKDCYDGLFPNGDDDETTEMDPDCQIYECL